MFVHVEIIVSSYFENTLLYGNTTCAKDQASVINLNASLAPSIPSTPVTWNILDDLSSLILLKSSMHFARDISFASTLSLSLTMIP